MDAHCGRCRGLMVREHFIDLFDDTGQLSFQGWRCVCCGNVLDPVIVRNRRTHRPAPSRVWAEERNVYEDYKRAFGEEPPMISGVAIMTDTDNTGESAEAHYGDIVFKKRPE